MDITQTTMYLDDLTALGVTLPTATATARDIYTEALRAARLDPSTGLKEALEAGTVTPENVAELVRQAARDLGAQAHASQIVRDLHVTLNQAMRAALREDVDRIHRELRAVFEPAAATVTKAAQHFGPSTTADEVIGGKPEAIKLWKDVTGASGTLDAVSVAYRPLVVDILHNAPDPMVALFVDRPADLDQASEVYRAGNGCWLALAHAGFKLKLNSPTEAQAVVQADADRKAKAAAAEREAQLAEHRRKYMPIGMR
jgi:hypothetical protein